MNHPITEADLLAADYRQHRIPLGSGELVDHFYQKSVASADGIVRYLIDVYHYDLSKHTPERPDGYKVEAMFRKPSGGLFVVGHREECSIEDHEAFFEQIWATQLASFFNEDEL
jgi:hypothetical protein